jgi:hypothetical protein
MKVSRRRLLNGAAGLSLLAPIRLARAKVQGTEVTIRGSTTMEIKRIGSRPSGKGPEAWFSGTVRVDPLFQAGDPVRVSGGQVTFEPGARTM